MPELAEVEYFRRCWDPGVGHQVRSVQLHSEKRIFYGTSGQRIEQWLPGAVLLGSEAKGKRLLFRFSKHLWLGLHLGMTGKLYVAPPDLEPGKHEHLVLHQTKQALVFNDARLFGQIRFDRGPNAPDWWATLPPSVSASGFSRAAMEAFLGRHPKLPIKAALLLQAGFPGIGNWMADEILWRARIHPVTRVSQLDRSQQSELWKSLRFVCRGALRHVASTFADPPAGWLFHERWQRAGSCPLHRTALSKQTVGGRTTVWCGQCQGGTPPVL